MKSNGKFCMLCCRLGLAMSIWYEIHKISYAKFNQRAKPLNCLDFYSSIHLWQLLLFLEVKLRNGLKIKWLQIVVSVKPWAKMQSKVKIQTAEWSLCFTSKLKGKNRKQITCNLARNWSVLRFRSFLFFSKWWYFLSTWKKKVFPVITGIRTAVTGQVARKSCSTYSLCCDQA